MKKKIALAAVAVGVIAIAVAIWLAGGNQGIRIGINKEPLEPMTFFKENLTPSGFEVDLFQEVGAALHTEVTTVRISWTEAYRQLKEKKVDVLIGAIPYVETNQEADYTKPYLTMELVALSKNRSYDTKESLKGKNIAVIKDSGAYNIFGFDAAFRELTAAWTAYGNAQDMMKALDAGQVDVVICDKEMAKLQDAGKYHTSKQPLETVSICAAVRKGNVKLLSQLQKALDELAVNGKGKTISEKWFGENLYYR